MANYECTARTNYFRVTDEDRYQKLFSGLIGDVMDFTKKNEEGVLLHGFGAYDSICWIEDGDKGEEGFDSFCDKLREILPEDEAFIYLEAGSEKLRYVTGVFTVVTKKEVRWGEINDLAVSAARDILGPDFKTEATY